MTRFNLTRPIRLSLQAGLVTSGDVVAGTGQPTANAFTLSGPTTGTTSTPSTFTVTPNGQMAANVIVTPAATNAGSVAPATLTFTIGSSVAQTFTVTRASNGTSVVSITNNGGLTNAGTPISYTSSLNPPVFTQASPPAGTVGSAYSYQFVATEADSYSLASGALPTGLTLSGSGLLSGTPTTVAAYSFVVRATNAAGSVDTGSLSVIVSAAAAGALNTTFTLTSSTSGTLPFTIGHAFKQGEVASGAIALSGASVSAQATEKNYWSNGSVKFAVIAGTYTSSGSAVTITMASGSASSGAALVVADLKAAMSGQTCQIACGAFGTASWATTDWDTPFQTWASGHRMSSWVYRKAVGSDAHLVAWLEVRYYATGAVEILPWVENGYLTVAGPTSKSAAYSFTLGATTRYSGSFDLPHHCRAALVSGSLTSHWLGSDPNVISKHNAAYMMSTELVPTYPATVSAAHATVTGLPSTWSPMTYGSIPAGMGNAGESGDFIAQWDLVHLLSSATATYRALERNGYAAGSYAMHYRENSGTTYQHRPIRFSSYPNKVMNDSSSGWNSSGSSQTSDYTPAPSGTTPPRAMFISHMRSMGYLAYLCTGRFFHMETVLFQSTGTFLAYTDYVRGYGQAAFLSTSSQSTRGSAWALRALAQAAAAIPDADVLASEFVTAVANNVNTQHATYVAVSNNPWGAIESFTNYVQDQPATTTGASTTTNIVLSGDPLNYLQYNQPFANGTRNTITIGAETRDIVSYDSGTNVMAVSPAFSVAVASQSATIKSNHFADGAWQQDYYTGVLGYIRALKFSFSTAVNQKLAELHAWKARSITHRFGGIHATDYLYRDAAAYYLYNSQSSIWNSGTPYPHAGDIWTDSELSNQRGTKALGDGTLRGTIQGDSYWGQLQPALSYAARFGVPGAVAARAKMRSASNWSIIEGDFADTDGGIKWGIAPATFTGNTTALAVAAASMAAGQWVNLTTAAIPGGAAFFIDPVNGKLYDYCHKGGYDPIKRQFRWLGMGHGGSIRQTVYDEATNTWSKNGPPSWFDGSIGHGYAHNCIDPETGDDYFRMFNDANGVNRYSQLSGVWSKTATEPTPTTAHGAIDYLPTIGTKGGLVLCIGNAIRRWDRAANSWATVLTITDRSTAAMSAYSPYHQAVYCGGGASSSTDWYMVRGTGTPVAIAACPLSANNTDKLAVCCPVSGDLLVMGSNTDCQRYNGSAWAAQSFSGAPAFTVTTQDGSVVSAIEPYGVILFQFGGTGQVWLYKHA